MVPLAVGLLLSTFPIHAWCGQAGGRSVSDAEAALTEAALAAGATPTDLDVRPSRWDTRMALPEAERLLQEPLSLPVAAQRWKDRLRQSEDPCGLLGLGIEDPTATYAGVGGVLFPDMVPAELGFDPGMRRAIQELAHSVDMSLGPVVKAVDSLTPDERRAVLQEVKAVVTNETGPRSDPAAYNAMARFDQAALSMAGRGLCRAARRGLPALFKPAGGHRLPDRRWKLSSGDALVVGPGERTFTAEEIKGVALLIHLGGKSVYKGPVAAAGEGEVKVVIDLAADVTIEDPGGEPTAGSGIFGIGLLFLPNASGAKKIAAGDFSMGAGAFGVGGLFIEGAGSVLQSGRFTQGAGAFGAGILWSRGEGASFKADLSGQGYGFTRGAGIFSHRGSKADLRCGLRYPDPREASAALSLCQGAGYGHRAFAGGGIGLGYLEGNDSSLTTNYFGQGSGYWHAIGGLFVRGDRNRLKARRYSQGAGIHTAIGMLTVDGNGNSLVSWGVGPAFGWDYGVGYWLLSGDDNTARADWGTGRGDANGHGLAVVRGKGNKLLLPEFGTGFFKRAAPGYGLASIQGKGNRLGLPSLSKELKGPLDLAVGSWGTVQGDGGLILDPKLDISSTAWPALDRGPELEKERSVLSSLLEAALKESGSKRVAGLLHAASAFSLDAQFPRAALRELFRTPAEGLPHLRAALSPDRFDEYLWLRVLLAGFGPEVSAWAASEFDRSSGTYRALLLQAARYGRLGQALPWLSRAIEDGDWRVRREAAGSIGYLFDREEGDEPGRLKSYEVMVASQTSREEAIKRLGWKRAVDVMAALSLAGPVASEERARLVDIFPGPNEPLPKETLNLFHDLLMPRSDRLEALRSELTQAARLEPEARKLLAKAVRDPDRDVAAAALVSLGALGDKDDSAVLAAFLDREDAKLREAASSGLARLGPAGRPAIEAALSSASDRARIAACKAAAQTWDPETLKLLGRCLDDPAAPVRCAGVSAMAAVQAVLQAEKRQFREALKKLADSDHSPSVRAAAAYAASQIPQ
ncbi:MAG: HEAT repeat domain-containing protein [Elusimicrobia bacterium]|nr:HEAT repeat domain-containing protein [Elusimicrobiota bacterium]